MINSTGEALDSIGPDSYLAIDVSTEYYVQGIMVYHMFRGQALLGVWVKFDNVSVFYMSVRHVTRYHSEGYKMAGLAFAKNFRQWHGHMQSFDWYEQFVGESSYKPNPVNYNDDEYLRLKITQDHHTLLRVSEIINNCGYGPVGRGEIKPTDHISGRICTTLEQLKRLGENTESAVATILLYSVVTSQLGYNVLSWLMSMANNKSELYSTLKQEGVMAKQLQHVRRSDLAKIFELNVLVNRVDKPVDWTTEIENRTTKLATVNISAENVYSIARRLFLQAICEGKIPRALRWESYWKSRWATMPTGSYISQYDEDIAEKKVLSNVRLANKTTVLSTVSQRGFEYYANRPPSIFASTSTKYEWGKTRALYGCDITSFMMSDFSMSDAEACLPEIFPVGERATTQEAKRVVSTMRNGIPFCYDYDDFNSQHSKSSMKTVLRAWLDVFGQFISDEQRIAAMWTIKSIDNMSARCNELGKQFRVDGTLFSGWRLTAFMNSILNRVYLEAAGLNAKVNYAIHNGDDVFASLETISDGFELVEKAEKLGIRAQKTKMSVGTIGEFLRVDCLASDPTGAQYLTRGCATAVHSRIESEASQSLEASLDATNDRVKSLVDRGADARIISNIEQAMVKRIASVFETDLSTCKSYYTLHPVQGGCNVRATVNKFRLVRVSEKGLLADYHEDIKKMAHGANDYVQTIVEKYKMDPKTVRRDQAYAMNATLVKATKTKLKTVIEDRQEVHHYISAYKSYKHKHTIIAISKARLLRNYNLVPFDNVSKYLLNYINKQDKPLEVMSYLL